MKPREIGFKGEDKAAEFLEALGYTLLERNFQTRYGELDIIAQDGECIVFAEVKTRINSNFADAAESVTMSKRKKLKTVARQWLARRNTDEPARFDVIEIYQNGDINHIIDAFQ